MNKENKQLIKTLVKNMLYETIFMLFSLTAFKECFRMSAVSFPFIATLVMIGMFLLLKTISFIAFCIMCCDSSYSRKKHRYFYLYNVPLFILFSIYSTKIIEIVFGLITINISGCLIWLLLDTLTVLRMGLEYNTHKEE